MGSDEHCGWEPLHVIRERSDTVAEHRQKKWRKYIVHHHHVLQGVNKLSLTNLAWSWVPVLMVERFERGRCYNYNGSMYSSIKKW